MANWPNQNAIPFAFPDLPLIQYRSMYGHERYSRRIQSRDFKDLPKTTIRDSNAAKDTRVVNYSREIIQNKEYMGDVKKEKMITEN